MSENTTIKLCVLWEGELREASRLLHAAHAEDLDETARTEAIAKAFNAAAVALWGLTDDHACVLIGSDEIRKQRAAVQKRRSDPDNSVANSPSPRKD